MTTFALVHGGGHRDWHWNLLRPALERLGHETIASNVPMNDPDAGAGDWADVVVKALAGTAEDDVIVVGHSLAGLALPVIGSRMKPRRMVFLCANVPVPGVVYNDYCAENPEAITVPWDRVESDELGRIVIPWDLAREIFYPDCDETLAQEAYAHVVPVAATGFTERCPLDTWPDVPSTYICATEDQVLGPNWARQMSIDRLGGPVIEIPGSHSPFLSRPDHLATVLNDIAGMR